MGWRFIMKAALHQIWREGAGKSAKHGLARGFLPCELHAEWPTAVREGSKKGVQISVSPEQRCRRVALGLANSLSFSARLSLLIVASRLRAADWDFWGSL